MSTESNDVIEFRERSYSRNQKLLGVSFMAFAGIMATITGILEPLLNNPFGAVGIVALIGLIFGTVVYLVGSA